MPGHRTQDTNNCTASKTMSTKTELTTDKVALLLKRLLNVKEKTQKGLPDDMEELVENFLDAQETFVRGIDKFMHRVSPEWKFDDKEAVTAIVETCPEFLQTVGHDTKGIPLHYNAPGSRVGEANGMYFLLFAKVGYEHGIGGKDGRGGLLVKDREPFNPLQNCARLNTSSHEVMTALMEMNPPLFTKEDVSGQQLLHCAAVHGNLEDLKFYIDLDPRCLFQKDEIDDYYPIRVCEDDIEAVQYLLKRALEYNPRHPSIGGLFSKYANSQNIFHDHNRVVLRDIISKNGKKKAWDAIEKELSPYKDIPILHRVIEHAPDQIMEVVSRFPHASFLRDENNRLPIHIALEKGIEWSVELVAIMNANMSHLNQKDPVTGYYPFALAAEEPRCDLRTIYHLLKMHPGQIESGMDHTLPAHKESKRRNTLPVRRSKRRRII